MRQLITTSMNNYIFSGMASKTIITEGDSKDEKRTSSNSWVINENMIISSLENTDLNV